MNPIVPIGVGVALLIGASALPIIPENLQFKYAYDQACPLVLPEQSNATSTPPPSQIYAPQTCIGDKAYIAVFVDSNNNTIYLEIPKEQFDAMQGVGGAAHNPKETAFHSILGTYLVPHQDSTLTPTEPPSGQLPTGSTTTPTEPESPAPSTPDAPPDTSTSDTDTASTTTP